MTSVAVIGCGYWGSKHVRVLHELPGVHLAMAADLSEARRAYIANAYPGVRITADYQDVLQCDDVQGVIIAAPVSTHYQLARQAILAGKDVLVEKPLTDNSAEARDLCELAARLGRVLMVGHTFLYHPAVRFVKDLVASGALGTIYYADTARLNLGLFQRDTDVIWDLAPHDVSILLYVLGSEPLSVQARGAAHVGAGRQIDVAFIDLMYPGSMIGNIRVSWLDPCKVRRVTIVGSDKMVVFNDVPSEEKVRIYDRGVILPHQTDAFDDFPLSYRYGGVSIPHIPSTEPLAAECAHFVECIEQRCTPVSDGWSGYRVVQLLEAAHASLGRGGMSVPCALSDDVLALAASAAPRPLSGAADVDSATHMTHRDGHRLAVASHPAPGHTDARHGGTGTASEWDV